MSVTEIIVVLIGVAAGYWMVSNFIDGKRDQQGKKGSGPRPASGFGAGARAGPRPGPRPATPFAPPAPRAPRWYEVLEVSPNASREEIRKAYQRLISLNHPDKVATMSEEIRAVADRKSKEIGAAYEEAQRAR